MQQQQPSVRAVTIPFADLKDRGKDLGGFIEEGFGPQGLGIVSIAGVPGYPELRKRLLRLAPRHVVLHSRGNTAKGSYFANPVFDVPTTDDELVTRYPSYCRPNIWPKDHLPELEIAFKGLGKLMLEVGLMLAHHCDRYVIQRGVGQYIGESLEKTLARSRCPKGRLLYYFPKSFSKQDEVSSWCGWHTDYGFLTDSFMHAGLTCGLFTRKSEEVPCPDIGTGLYVRTRDNQVVKVTLVDDELVYQIGETAEILSRGHLCATPHCVKAPSSEDASDVGRSTFVLFIQPNWDEPLKLPSEIRYHQECIPPTRTLAYGEYSERVLASFSGKSVEQTLMPQ
ncbi:hypothetical protein Zm00014a_026928 [Zea mays]|uniref:Fe2OG dioxygenase domain-containing protein n=1 Tax=Zea mays TaxID=4577 RepID=A0A3L6DQ13_MAIZE|nr:hypothetical protein Zm00014a_026928 [Zea mays]